MVIAAETQTAPGVPPERRHVSCPHRNRRCSRLLRIKACRISRIRSTTTPSTSPAADAFACTAKRSTSARSSQDRPSVSKKLRKVLGLSVLWIMILAISILRRKLCNLWTTLSARGCHLCLRYILLPMSPDRTLRQMVRPGGFELPTFWFVVWKTVNGAL